MTPKAHKKIRYILKEVAIVATIFAIVFFGGRQVNSWLGQKALTETGIAFQSYEAAVEQAIESGKPVLLEFGAVWCGSCRKLNSQVMADERVKQKIHDNYVAAHVEWTNEEDQPIFQHFGIQSFPQILILDPNTGSYRRIPTTFDPEQFLELI